MGSPGDDFNLDKTDPSDIPDEEELHEELEYIELDPSEHQRIKELILGEKLSEIESYERRYLVCGAGGQTGAATRRLNVLDRLDSRTDPPATAFRLEDFGLTRDELKLWARAFDILCGRATHIVMVIEDFNGSYVWEMGYAFSPGYRGKTWILKRRYENEDQEREMYDDGMAISHVKLLLTGPRVHEWSDMSDLLDVVEEIP